MGGKVFALKTKRVLHSAVNHQLKEIRSGG